MVCPNCGAEQPEGAHFCNRCGTRLSEPVLTTVNLTCARCGHVNPDGSKFCGECGAPLESAPLAPAGRVVTPARPAAEPPAPPTVSTSLRLISSNGTTIHFPPNQANAWLIGREDPVNNIHPDIDLTPYDPDRTVSRRHARIMLTAGNQPTIVSITTTNWTRINGTRIETGQPVLLCSGDRIELGRCMVTFEMSGPIATNG
ncbi:MAG: zinc-ribbon domain-containing protein [Anaerolineae bacterium]|nr:zinc-ribbon domain-containing protein [Anaerolineae bacterium]